MAKNLLEELLTVRFGSPTTWLVLSLTNPGTPWLVSGGDNLRDRKHTVFFQVRYDSPSLLVKTITTQINLYISTVLTH